MYNKLWYQIYIFTLMVVFIDWSFFNKTFLVKGKSEIIKYFFLSYVIILKCNICVISSDPPFIEWHVRCTFETFIVSEARNARVTFVEKPQIKIFSFLNRQHRFFLKLHQGILKNSLNFFKKLVLKLNLLLISENFMNQL